MSAVHGLSEVAGRAAQAESTSRSVAWLNETAIGEAATKVSRSLDRERTALSRPGLSAVEPSPTWRTRLAALVDPARDEGIEAAPADPFAAAAQAEADADAAVAVAGLALTEAHRAVLRAREAALRAGDSEAVATAVRGYRPLKPGSVPVRYGKALQSGTSSEFSNVVRTKPRPILIKLAIGLGLGLGYLLFLRLFQWDTKSEILPYLAPYALSGVIGGVVCTNALSWDATRVRRALTSGERLWLLLLSKNATMFVLVGAAGLLLSVLFAWRAGDFSTLLKALGELATMMLIWLGVGNVLSVILPLRVEPLKMRFKDGTLRPFLFSFVTSYVIGLGVNLILTWKIWAKQSMIAELGGAWVPVLMLVFTALVTYLLLTVLAVSLADQPRIRRALLREMVDYKTAETARPLNSPLPAPAPGSAQEATNQQVTNQEVTERKNQNT